MESNPADTPPPIRLSILHLLLLMTCIGVLLGIQPKDVVRSEAAAWEVYYYQLLIFCSSALGGVSLASLWLLGRHGFQVPAAFPRQPGHWLLVIGGLVVLVRNGFYLAFLKNHVFASREILANWYTFSTSVQALTWVVVAVVALLSLERGGWRTVFAFPLGWHVLYLLGVCIAAGNEIPMQISVVRTIMLAENIFFMLLVLWQSYRDRRQKRDWLHYAGVAVYSLNGLFSLAVYDWYSRR